LIVGWFCGRAGEAAGIQAVGWAPGNEETYHEPNEEIDNPYKYAD